MKEYKMLREEIMFNLNKLHWYLSIVSTISIALLTYIIKNPNDIILLSLFLAVLIIMEGRVHAMTVSNIRISTYMEIFLEPDIDIKWETYSYYKIDNYNSRTLPLAKKFPINFITGINAVCLFIGVIAFVFNIIVICRSCNGINILFTILNVVLLFILIYMAYINRGGQLYRDDYIKHWKQIKEIMQKETSENLEIPTSQQHDSP